MARRAQSTASSCSPRQVVALARLHSSCDLLAVALDRCEQFGARLGVTLHAEQHHACVCRAACSIVGIEFDWHGATRPRLLQADWSGQASRREATPAACASGASAVAASSASIASARRPSRSSRTPAHVSSTGFSGSSSPPTRATPAARLRSRQRVPRPPGAARTPASAATGAAPRRTPIRRAACRRSASARGPRRPRPRPGQARCRSSAAAGRAQSSPSPRRISRPAKPKQRRLAPRIDVRARGRRPVRRRANLPAARRASAIRSGGSSHSGSCRSSASINCRARTQVAGLLLRPVPGSASVGGAVVAESNGGHRSAVSASAGRSLAS